MAVKIGHASIDERGKANSGSAGDQTGKEVKISNYYVHSKGWVVLRCKDDEKRKKIAEAMEKACKNNQIGYDQYQRNTLFNNVKDDGFDPSKTTKKVETDCSALVRVCIAYAYGSDKVGNIRTVTLPSTLVNTGLFTKYTSSKYCKSSDYLKRGDILCTPVSGHTVVALNDGAKVGVTSTTSEATTKKLTVDGEWGKDTTRMSQKVLGTTVDGIVSNQPASCKEYIPNALMSSWEFEENRADYKNGSALIKAIQKLVGADVDGHCGKKTIAAMQTYLADKGYEVGSIDGIMGNKTVKAWQKFINDKMK